MLLTILKNKSLDYLRLEQNKLNAMSELSELYVRELDIRVSSLEACDPSEIFSEEVNQIIHPPVNFGAEEPQYTRSALL